MHQGNGVGATRRVAAGGPREPSTGGHPRAALLQLRREGGVQIPGASAGRDDRALSSERSSWHEIPGPSRQVAGPTVPRGLFNERI